MSADDVILSVRGLGHWFGRHHVLHNVDLNVHAGQVVAIVGPSGCGKSTLLRAIVGTHPPCRGSILMRRGVNGDLAPVTGPGRDRGIVYQRYSLFPFLTAQQNVAFGLMLDRSSPWQRLSRPAAWRDMRREHLRDAAALLERFGLASAMDLYPAEMSGGMCQRVAIAQALIMKPSLLLLDEPFGALDEATREELQRMLLTLYQENLRCRAEGRPPPHTILIVTHEINEALFVSDRAVGLSQYWDWGAEGCADCPGATIVYDQPAPVFSPTDPRNFERLRAQKDEILHAVFDPGFLQNHYAYVQLAERTQAVLQETR